MTQKAIIVAHGQPSDPAPAELDVATLAAKVSALLPGWRIGSATLALPDRLSAAIEDNRGASIFPLFMSDGWFTTTFLPARLAAAGASQARLLTPFGMLDGCRRLAAEIVTDAARRRGWIEQQTKLVLAAHGSARSRTSAEAAQATAAAIAAATGFEDIRTGFIEQTPRLDDAARLAGPQSLCLPLFAAQWGHVETDIPRMLRQAGFAGTVLAPIGCHPSVPAVIAAALQEAEGDARYSARLAPASG